MDSICQLDLSGIGNRIRECRENNNLSQEKLAEMVDVSKNSIYSIENGKSCFRIDKLICFANTFGVTTDYILNGEKGSVEDDGRVIGDYEYNELVLISRTVCNEVMKIVHSTYSSDADEIRRFKELLDEGIITEEEFQQKKKQILGL